MQRVRYFLLLGLSLGVALYALAAYSLLPPGTTVHPDLRASFDENRAALYTHVFAAAIALLLGPLQFSQRLRAARPALHRWLGRLYLGAGVLVGGTAGLALALQSAGGLPAQLGFALLALAWLYTGARAYTAIRARDVAAHRRWMLRNFGLCFAAVTLRLWLPALLVAGIPFDIAYPLAAWLCWVPNAAFVERLLHRPAAAAAIDTPKQQHTGTAP